MTTSFFQAFASSLLKQEEASKHPLLHRLKQRCVCVNLLSLYRIFLLIIKLVRADKTQLYPILSDFQPFPVAAFWILCQAGHVNKRKHILHTHMQQGIINKRNQNH